MAFCVFGDKRRVGQWVMEHIPGMEVDDGLDYEAIGVCSDDGELIAGVLFNHFTGYDISMHVAAERGRLWATPKVLKAIFSYPFNQLKCRRVTGFVSAINTATIKFDLKAGFVIEGRLRDATPEGDMIILGMTRNECRWLGKENG
jgi:RimJ/RimL family protein N-acetyltransferase